MKNLKVGEIITTAENEKYLIVKFLKVNQKNYMFCSTVEEPIRPAVLEYKIVNKNLCIRLENDINLIKEISKKVKESIE